MRLAAIAILLLGSTSASAATDGKLLNSDEALRLAPPAPTLPKGLPLAERLNSGVWLPHELAHGLHIYVVEWEHYPEQAQAAMDALAEVHNTQCAEQRRLDAAQATVASDKRAASAEAHRLTWGKVLTIGGVSAALGALVVLIAEH